MALLLPRSLHNKASSYLAFYSTVAGLARTNWGTSGHAPQSLVAAEDDDHRPTHTTHSDSSPSPLVSRRRAPPQGPTPHMARAHRETMKETFPEGWAPPRKLSRAAMDGLRWLHAQDPETCTTPVLAQKFRISPEAVRRILKSKWEPSKEKRDRLLQRERERREEWIAGNRQEERKKQDHLLMNRRGTREHDYDGERGGREQQEEGKQRWTRTPRGVSRNDKLSFT
ncbi:Required for respiratory growth protein 9 mitochondrial [Steccherinum ochraceum]|uniref:Required for respiratory growth protein 9, mitochondrial n=1 Tax=Steccherinum ochraceum TaxID=92696 RepID=A0A4R0R6C3_9APHY|nr:Required for respiratory growth protein 9 mitochondrial [Steccherinum ochraceum]